ncbi:hypothetical protein VJ923_01630 [Adlercreutzia sp. R25]|uniref:hypothetical protein n=1 Tax=Adlercreutzia shanghongiae TaxID=3111773 RepID=UPI002DBC1446|nr:hypothetical protein [Adlercreutzia sp. R25]MEC4271859.1 hypothetical protein [Adlercreutzia sp. R25]
MKAKAFAFNAIYNVIFSAVMSAVVTLASASVGGFPILPESFAVDFGIGFCIAWVIGMVFPIRKMGETFAHAVGASSRVGVSLLSALICGTFFFCILNFVMTAIHSGFGTFMGDTGMPISFMNRYMDGLLTKWLYTIFTVVMTMPLAFMVAHKVTGFPPHADQEKDLVV